LEIRINGLVNDSIVDGPGLRFAVFTQGCFRNCPGCHNPDTHDPLGGTPDDTDRITGLLRENPLLDGLTLTGGEPFEQPAACLKLAQGAKALGLNVWAYSGYTYVERKGKSDPDIGALLALLDILVDGPFDVSRRSLELDFRGSCNQRLLDLKKSGEGNPVLWQPPAW
jgi:anaerobic ribonucleoside-triphosphate reductase activating protein